MPKKKTKKEIVEELYVRKYKPMKLAPAHVRGIKAAMLAAARKRGAEIGEINGAARMWLKEKGLSGKKAAAKKTVTKKTVAKKKAAPAKKTSKKTPKKKAPSVKIKKATTKKEDAAAQEVLSKMPKAFDHLKEPTLRGIAKDLGIKLTRKDDLDTIRGKVSDKIVGLTPDIEAIVKDIDRDSVKECIGLYIDLKSAACLACPNRDECLKKFKIHQENGFAGVPRKTHQEILVEEVAEEVEEEDIPEPEKRLLKQYNGKQRIECYGVEFDEDDDAFDLMEAIKERVPETIRELAPIILRHMVVEDKTKAGKRALVVETVNALIDMDCIELID